MQHANQAQHTLYVVDKRVHSESDGQYPAQAEQDRSRARHVPQRKHCDREHCNPEQQGRTRQIDPSPLSFRDGRTEHANSAAKSVVRAIPRVPEPPKGSYQAHHQQAGTAALERCLQSTIQSRTSNKAPQIRNYPSDEAAHLASALRRILVEHSQRLPGARPTA
jgi:hypothetical protein